jgi:hypothetical protein
VECGGGAKLVGGAEEGADMQRCRYDGGADVKMMMMMMMRRRRRRRK